MRIWVRLKRHHRRNRAKTILFFHSYDRKCTVVKSRQNPASSYIQLSSLDMFSSQIAQNAVVTTQVGLPYSYYDETIAASRLIITSHLTLIKAVEYQENKHYFTCIFGIFFVPL